MRLSPLAILAAVISLWPLSSHAYIDPGTGSMLLQSALAAVAAVLVFGRSLWHKVKGFFDRSGERTRPADRDPDKP